MKVELIAVNPGNTVNVVGWEVQCCDGPVAVTQAGTYAGTEGRIIMSCPRCRAEFILHALLRRISQTPANAEVQRRRRQKEKAA